MTVEETLSGQSEVRRKGMTEGQREAPDRPEAERYYAQHASLDVEGADSAQSALQAAINEGRATAGSWSA